jgi:hypothetical protein
MAATEGLPCTTEVHALRVAPDGALWTNTCARFFRFDGQRFQAIAWLSGMATGAQGMTNLDGGHVAVVTPSGLSDAAADGQGGFTAHLYALGPELLGTLVRGMVRIGKQLWFGCGRRLCVEEGGRVTTFGPGRDCRITPETRWRCQ